jgi:hypothetical protein
MTSQIIQHIIKQKGLICNWHGKKRMGDLRADKIKSKFAALIEYERNYLMRV